MYKNIRDNLTSIQRKEVHSIYYLLTFLSDFAISTISAIYVLFLLSNGLNLLQVNLVNFAFMIGNFVFEIPTGAFADYFGRRKSVILSNIFLAIAFATYFFASSFLVFIIAETISALAFTFESGALDAWLVDTLKEKGIHEKTDIIFSHASIISQSAGLFGGLVGAYIGSKSLRLPIGAASIVSIIAVIATSIFMKENFIPKEKAKIKDGIKNIVNVAKEGMLYGINHKVILWFTLAAAILNFAFQPLNMYWSPRLYSLAGHQVLIVGWAWVGVSLFMMIGGIIVRRIITDKPNYFFMFLMTLMVLALPILLAAISQTFYIVLTAFLTYEIGRGMLSPLQKSYLNKHIQSSARATVLSFNSMIAKLGAAAGLVVMGVIAQYHSIQVAWGVSALIILCLIPVFMRINKHEVKIEKNYLENAL